MSRSLVDPRPVPLASFAVGRVGLGCARWDFQSTAELTELVHTARDLGANLIDVADVYGGEAGPGRAEDLLGQIFGATPALREQFFVATKAGAVRDLPYNSSKEHLIRACEESLRRLRSDYVDVFQVHRPDFFAHPAEVAEALSILVRQGKTRHVGVSNYTPSQLDALMAHLPDPIVSTSPQISIAHLDALRDGTLDQAAKLDLTVLAWGPLAKGRLITGERVRPELLSRLDRLAEREGVSRTAIAMAFVLALPGKMVTLLGSTDPGRFRAAAAATSVNLSREDLYILIQASEGRTLP